MTGGAPHDPRTMTPTPRGGLTDPLSWPSTIAKPSNKFEEPRHSGVDAPPGNQVSKNSNPLHDDFSVVEGRRNVRLQESPKISTIERKRFSDAADHHI